MNTQPYNQHQNDDDVTEAISSPYLKGADLPQQPQRLTIKGVTKETFATTPDQPAKFVVSFYEISKRLICNKTQLRSLAELFGTGTQGWKDQPIIVQRIPSSFNGKPTISVHITGAPTQFPGASAHGLPAIDPDVEFLRGAQ